MTLRPSLLAVAMLAVACGGDPHAGPRGTAELRLGERGPYRIALRATVCARDSTIALVGAGADWGLAIGIRAPWPPDDTAFGIRGDLDQPGAATIAVRALGDSIAEALTGRSGTLYLQRDNLSLSGRLSGLVDGAGRDDSVSAAVQFADVPAVLDACP